MLGGRNSVCFQRLLCLPEVYEKTNAPLKKRGPSPKHFSKKAKKNCVSNFGIRCVRVWAGSIERQEEAEIARLEHMFIFGGLP